MQTLPFCAESSDDVELTVTDLGVARALWEGVPTGRLLARIRLHRDERDLIDLDQRASGMEFKDASWDIALARLLGAAPTSLERVRRAVARHARPASDEGPLAGDDTIIAALVHVHLSGTDADASPAEGVAECLALEEPVRIACARADDRLGRTSGDRRAPSFEACLALAKRVASQVWPLETLQTALGLLASVAEERGSAPNLETLPDVMTPASAPLYPWGEGEDVAIVDRRTCLLDRPTLERLLLRPQRELSLAIARAGALRPSVPFAQIAPDVASVVSKYGALLLVARREPRSQRDVPPIPPASWRPADLDATETALALASALERGTITAPRARSLMIRGGDLALDAIGKEMLNVAGHPFASTVFAELLAPFARERDVVRLVTYFAIAPDPSAAAHALNLCSAREVVRTVLKAWLETMLPADGALAEPGHDPDTSAGARVALCLSALRPYAGLYDMVEPLLSRLSELPPG